MAISAGVLSSSRGVIGIIIAGVALGIVALLLIYISVKHRGRADVTVSLGKRLIVGLIMVMLSIIAAIGVTRIARAEVDKQMELRRDGVTTRATVVEITERSRGGEPLAVRVRFGVGKSDVMAAVDLSQTSLSDIAVGDVLDVVYDPANQSPATSLETLSIDPWRASLPVLIASGCLMVVGLFLIGSGILKRRRALHGSRN